MMYGSSLCILIMLNNFKLIIIDGIFFGKLLIMLNNFKLIIIVGTFVGKLGF